MTTDTKPKPTLTTKHVKGSDPKLQEELKKIGITASVTRDDKSTDTVEPLFLSLSNATRSRIEKRDAIVIDLGTSNCDFYLDKKERQAVLVCKEKTRKITQTFEFSAYRGSMMSTSMADVKKNERLSLERARRFPIVLPVTDPPVKYIVDKIDVVSEGDLSNPYAKLKATVTAEIPASEQTFLFGWDEKAMFISMLPQVVRSVKRAHEVLRPKGVPKDAARQGEFFFVPVNQKTSDALDSLYEKGPYQEAQYLGQDMEMSDNHMAMGVVETGGKQYACGIVWDTDKRHDMLWLDGWCEVVRNTELVTDNMGTMD